MDFQSVPWRRKRSSGMSICETESSGSLSSFETYSGELDVLRTSAVGSSQDDTRPSSSKSVEAEDTIKSLTEKLSDARMSLRAKEDLVKQHAKVAEEALFGWENSEKEVASLKQHLKAAKQKNSSLEERLGQVDDALKECVRQLGQSREEQEKRIQDAIVKKTCELESHKSELETHLIVLQKQLKEKAKKHNSFNCELCSKIEMLEKENASLKVELMSLNESLRARTLEMEFSIRAAEMASKQHLESIKKVAKLEAECRSLHARTHKPSLSNDHRLICNSLYGESLTDSQSDSAERLCCLDNELSVPDSWASALIAELDQFKNEKAITKCLNCPIEIELMDDFLEMERLAATTDADYGSSSFEHDTDLDTVIPRQSSPRYNIQSMQQQIAMLEERIKQMSVERGEMEASLSKTNCQLKISQDQLTVVEGELVELHRQFNFVSAEKHTQLIKLEILEANRKNMELELESAAKEIGHLKNGIEFLEGGVKVEKPPLIAVFSTGCQRMEALDSEIKEKGTENELLKRETMRSHDNKNILVEEMEEEKTVFEECTFRYQNLDSSVEKVKELNSQLESVTLEPPKKHEKFDLTERSEVLSSQPIANCRIIEAIDAKERQVDYENSSEGLEIPELEEKTDLSKTKVEEEMPLSSELGSDLDSQVAKKIELVVQLELEQREVRSLQDKVHILEKKIDKEKALAAEYAARCYALENELSWNKLADIQQSANSDESSKIRQGNEVAQAGGRLAKCQKTIASLNLQLKSLATLDDFLFDANMPDPTDEPIKHNGDPRLLDFGGSPEKIGGCSSHLNDTPGLSFAHCSEISPPSSTVEAMSRNPSTLISEKETESNHF